MPTISDHRHEAFCLGVMRGLPKYLAYRQAGFESASDSTAATASARLSRKVHIQARIKELQNQAAEAAIVNSAMIMQRMYRNIQIAMGDLPVTVTRIDRKTGKPTPVETYTYDGTTANRGLELLGRELGMFTERREIGGPGDFSGMNDKQLVEFISQRLAARGKPAMIEGEVVDVTPAAPTIDVESSADKLLGETQAPGGSE